MAEVKGRRKYASPKRAEQARETRRQIVEAAGRLFTERGYPSTTVDAIAAAAGVAVQTVYAAVGSKRHVLWAVLERAVAGDDAADTVVERFRREVYGVRSAGERLERATRFGRRTMERSVDVHRIMRSAAGDAEVAAALAEVERRRYRDARALVALVAGDGGIARGATARAATDVWFGATSYEMYELLVVERRWTPLRYERWVASVMAPLLA